MLYKKSVRGWIVQLAEIVGWRVRGCDNIQLDHSALGDCSTGGRG